MNQALLPKNHYTLNITTDVAAICEPFKKHNIAYFIYARCFDEGEIYTLTNNRDSYYFHFQNEYMVAPPLSNEIIANNFYYLPFANAENDRFNQAYLNYQNLFKFGQPIYMFERGKRYVDLFLFAGKININLVNFYVNNLDVLESFKTYFKEKANKLIQKANKNRIILPNHMRLNFTGLAPTDEATKNINLLKDQAKNINLLLQLHFNTKLTVRELQSLGYLLRGRTAAETAHVLNISPKTVEFYIDSVKTKLNCLSRAELFDKFIDAHLIKMITKI